jgi:hypothetical protein
MGQRTSTAVVAASTALVIAWSAPAFAQGVLASYDRGRASTVAAPPGQVLAVGSGSAPAQVVANYLRARGFSAASLEALRQAGRSSARNGMLHLRIEQEVGGLAVQGRYLRATLNQRGELVHVIENLATVPAAPLAEPTISARQALKTAMGHLYPGAEVDVGLASVSGSETKFERGRYFFAAPTVTRVAVPMSDGSMTIGLLVETWSRAKNRLHHTLIGGDGRILDVQLRTANDSYNVFPINPNQTPQTVIAGPGAGNAQSLAGWLGTGNQWTTLISGNNVSAYLDIDDNNHPDHGGTPVVGGDFLTTADLGKSPWTPTNQAVAVQNLFYLSSVIHDVLYEHGFDEPAGNFQADNFGRGGKGTDPLQAEAQNGGGINNANFAVPPDGRSPRMQVEIWNLAGITHRLTVNGTNFAARGAYFGPSLTTTGVTGQLLAAFPADGCTAIGTPLSGSIALIDRAGSACDFTTKVLNAQAAGAVAVVVVNDRRGTEVFTMPGSKDYKRVKIPSIMIGQNDGAALKLQIPVTSTEALLEVQPLPLDSALDTDVVFHEYGHGLTWRMIGDMTGPLAAAIGEGMSDGVAMLMNDDDVIGEYSTGNPNRGVRRFRYQGYPLTYKAVTGAEVHNDGEIYGAIVWRMIELFRTAYGDEPGRSRLFGYVVDGMHFTPSMPTYEQMRDGILASVSHGSTPSDCNLVWQAFGQFGVGQGSQGVVNGSMVQITESFVVPACN